MKKIVFLSFRDLSYGGGTPIRITGLVKNLKKSNINPIIISEFKNPSNIQNFASYKEIPPLNKVVLMLLRLYCAIKILRFILKPILKNNKSIKEVVKVLSEYKDDYIIVFQKNYFVNQFLKSFGFKLIYDVHGIKFKAVKFSFSNYFNLLEQRNTMQGINYLLVATLETKKYLVQRFRINPLKIFVIKEGIELSNFDKFSEYDICTLKDKFKVNENDNTVIFAGGLKEFDGIDHFIEAIEIVEKNYEIKVLLICPLSDLQYIENKFTELNLKSKIVYIGIVPSNEIIKYLSMSKIVACITENHIYNSLDVRTKVFQALATGKPVLYGDFGCFRNVGANEKNVCLYKAGNAESLANKIMFLFKNNKEADAIGENGLRFLNEKLLYKYSSKILAEKIKGIYKKC